MGFLDVVYERLRQFHLGGGGERRSGGADVGAALSTLCRDRQLGAGLFDAFAQRLLDRTGSTASSKTCGIPTRAQAGRCPRPAFDGAARS